MDSTNATVLVTGAAGYIGSHTVVKLLENGNMVVALDNLSNCYRSKDRFMPESLLRVQELTARSIQFIPANIVNQDELDMIFMQYHIDCVIHFAGLKSVGESCKVPLEYYRNNVVGSLNLLDSMNKFGCRRLIYSSSATVYGNPKKLPIDEGADTGNCSNPYGWTKFVTENILSNLCKSDERWKVLSLRYFNPVGAHESGRIGEDPNGIPNNLMPFVAQVAIGKLPEVKIFGNDYDTKDGTGVRDYIHIQDLAYAHIKALSKIFENDYTGFRPYNIGTGKGHSVLDVINAFEHASGKMIPHSFADRRAGDIAECYCDCKLANQELGWYAEKTITEMCEDMWRWQTMNPHGYCNVTEQIKSGCSCTGVCSCPVKVNG